MQSYRSKTIQCYLLSKLVLKFGKTIIIYAPPHIISLYYAVPTLTKVFPSVTPLHSEYVTKRLTDKLTNSFIATFNTSSNRPS